MKKPVLVVMAAGMGSRYGGLKQIDPIDREGHIIMDFSIYDAVKAGFEKVVFIIKKENEEDFRNAIGDRLSKQIQVAYVFQDLYNLPEGYEGKRFYHISTDEVYGALELTHPEGKSSDISAHEVYGDEFFKETTKYNPHSPYSASKAGSDHFVRAFHDTYGMPTIVTNCSNNYGPCQFPEKLIPLFINNIRHRKPLPVYGKGENVRDWLYVVDHARAIDVIFHNGKVADTYNIGGFNEWKNIDIIHVIVKTVDRLLGNPEGHSEELITYVMDRMGHDLRYAIDSTKLKNELGWEPSLQFEEGIEKTVQWYLDNQEWMDNITNGAYESYYEDMYKNR